MAGFAPGGGIVSTSGGTGTVVDVSETGLVKATPRLLNISSPTANTEVVISLPARTVSFFIQSRLSARMQLTYIAGTSAITYLSVPAGANYSEEGLEPNSYVLYVQTTKPSDVVEVLYWTV